MDHLFRRLLGWLDQLWFGLQAAMVYSYCRIAFAVVSIANLIDLFPHRYHFFAPTGLVDQTVVVTLSAESKYFYFSAFHYISGPEGVNLIFGVAFLAMLNFRPGQGALNLALLSFGVLEQR